MTIYDIAKEAGVAASTVSRVINNKPGIKAETRKKVQDILAFSKGSLVVLDKLAGDQVDLFVNGKCIAKGDVVVIDDNFGVRITEIVQKPSLDITQKK